MNNFIILTPTFDDWKSLSKLLFEIDKNINEVEIYRNAKIMLQIHL